MKKINKNITKILLEYNKFLEKFEIFQKTNKEFPNTYGYNLISNDISRLQKSIKKTKPGSKFEALILKQISRGLQACQARGDFQFNYKNFSIDDFCKVLFGNDSLKNLELYLRNMDYKQLWKYYSLETQYSYNRLHELNDNIYCNLKEEFKKIKPMIIDWGFKQKLIPSGFNITVDLIQYNVGSNYNPGLQMINIDINFVLVFLKKNKISYNWILILPTIFHEYFGHALNGFYSREMPGCFNADFKPGVQFFNKPVSEGIANAASRLALDFVKEYKKELKVTNKDLDYLNNLLNSQLSFYTLKAYFEYLKIKKVFEADLNIKKEIIQITENPGLIFNFNQNQTPDFSNFLYYFSLFSGSLKVQSIINKTSNKNTYLKTFFKLLQFNSNLDILEEMLKIL
ncbi:hypothetical protein KAU33_13190 [Candidatus Dependentiae bacterium]|nr:hypothetical protein [Candidatus Dependentiae bacterium]